jgi:hypothetical protein
MDTPLGATASAPAPDQLNWRAIVAKEQPGHGTPVQQARAAALAGILPDLEAWAQLHAFPLARIKASAFIGVIGVTQPDLPLRALAFAKYTVWLFALDEFIDLLDCHHVADDQVDAKQVYLDHQLAPLSRALRALESGAAEDIPLGPETLLAPRGTPSEGYRRAALLAAAFHDIYLSLEHLSAHLTPNDRTFCLHTFVREAAQVVAAMRGEAQQNYRYQATGGLPAMDDYLTRARFSICVRAAAALALGFEPNPRGVWSAWLPAMAPGAMIIRMANDLANVEREFAERKVNGIVIALAERGVAALPRETIPPAALDAAKAQLAAARHEALGHFETLLRLLPDGPVAQNVINGVAFSVAMYEDGDYIPPSQG